MIFKNIDTRIHDAGYDILNDLGCDGITYEKTIYKSENVTIKNRIVISHSIHGVSIRFLNIIDKIHYGGNNSYIVKTHTEENAEMSTRMTNLFIRKYCELSQKYKWR